MDMKTGDIYDRAELTEEQTRERMQDGSRRFQPIPRELLGEVRRASKNERIAMMRELQSSQTARNRAKRDRKRARKGAR